jgi:hypothetical protein
LFNTKFYICSKQDKKNLQHFMTQIVKHENSFTDIMSIGKAFAESGMFTDVKTAAQAVVKITAGAEMGIPPFASMSGIHIIQGKPTVGAGLLAARVKGSGKYDYRVKQQDDKVCIIDFYQGGELIGTSTFTAEDAKKAGTKNLDKFPRNMLFARAMSNGAKWYCPDLFAGPVYVPEDFNEVVETTAEVVPTHNDHVRHILGIQTIGELKEYKGQIPADMLKDKGIHAALKDRYDQLKNMGVPYE